MVAECKPCSIWKLEVNSVEKCSFGKNRLMRALERDHSIKVKLTWFKKSFHLCAAGERKETVNHLSKVNFYVSIVIGKP